MVLRLEDSRLEQIEADGILLPVDGSSPALGSGAARGIRSALPPEERMEELEAVEDELRALRPIPNGEARIIAGVARWKWIVVSASYPHNVSTMVYSAADCAALIQRALPRAFQLARAHGLQRLAATLIGTAQRLSAAQAATSFLAGSRGLGDLDVLLCIPDPAQYEIVRDLVAKMEA